MSIDLLQMLSLASYILASVLFLIAVALFFLLNIPKLYGDISGSTARKAIEAIRQQNEESCDKVYKPSHVNVARGKVTDKISPSGKLKQGAVGIGAAVSTEKLTTTKLFPLPEETTVLNNVQCDALILNEDEAAEQTTVLSSAEISNDFYINIEISFTESSEIIE